MCCPGLELTHCAKVLPRQQAMRLRLNEFNVDFASGGMGINDAQKVGLVHVDPAGLHCQ